VTYGHPQLQVSRVINTILSFLVILLITCGLFPCVLNLILLMHFRLFLLMSQRSLVTPLNTCSATMGESSTIPSLAPLSSLVELFYACLAPTLLPRMVRLNALFVPPTISSVPYYSRLPFLLNIGLKVFTQPPIVRIAFLPKLYKPSILMLLSLAPFLPMIIFRSLDVLATITSLLRHHTN
jgi:hypothetical protein